MKTSEEPLVLARLGLEWRPKALYRHLSTGVSVATKRRSEKGQKKRNGIFSSGQSRIKRVFFKLNIVLFKLSVGVRWVANLSGIGDFNYFSTVLIIGMCQFFY